MLSSACRLANARLRKKKTANAMSHSLMRTPVAALPASIRMA